MSELRVYLRHVRAASLCARGSRAWFEHHGLSWNNFLTQGIAASELRALDDALANRVIEAAEKEARDGEV